MSHLKRQEVPKNWPIPRKGTAYVVKPLSELSSSIPLLIILRNILNVAKNRREVKRSIHLTQILLNTKKVKDEKASLSLFDTLSIIPLKKNYRVELSEKGKFEIKEIKEGESNYKIAKITDKRTLRGKKTQLNLSDGRNFLSTIKCAVNDSGVINLKEGKIEKCLPLKENSRALVIAGKHAGETGVIRSIDKERKMVSLESKDASVNVLIKQLIIIE
ncbi:MAG: KOW motif-containing protein [Nanoarchaeota archaeon]